MVRMGLGRLSRPTTNFAKDFETAGKLRVNFDVITIKGNNIFPSIARMIRQPRR